MERFIPIPKDYYDEGFDICTEDGITFQEGVSILVGCNGYGKTTTLNCIKHELNKLYIPYILHDNHTDNNKQNTMEAAMQNARYDILSTAAFSSEGENISLSLSTTIEDLSMFLRYGETERSKRSDAFAAIFDEDAINERIKKKKESKERWLLFDAIDSGYSIDNIVEFKGLLDLLLEDSQKFGLNTFIIITANSYEMTVGLPCIDIHAGKYIDFESYDHYKKFILETAQIKKERYA